MFQINKTNYFVIFAFLFGLTFLSSCGDLTDQITPAPSVKSINDLETDERFIQFLTSQYEFATQAKDFERAQAIVNKKNFNTNDHQELALSLGFNTYKELNTNLNHRRDLIQALEADYQLSSLGTDVLEAKIQATILRNGLLETMVAAGGGDPEYDACISLCNRDLIACVAVAAAGAVVGVIACPTSGPYVFICEVAVGTGYLAALALCDSAHIRCTNDCSKEAAERRNQPAPVQGMN